MDAIALLKEDHEKAKKLINELEQTTERGVKTREEKWTKLLKDGIMRSLELNAGGPRRRTG